MLFYLIRKPVFDIHQMVIGYEIVYRGENNFDANIDYEYEEGTSNLLLNSYLDTGMETLIDGRMTFIQFEEELLINDVPILLSNNTTVIQISSNISPTESLLDKVKQFKADGYIIALKNYSADYLHSELLSLCDIIQVNVHSNNHSALKNIVHSFSHSSQILMAQGLMDIHSYHLAKKLGFELFEGSYFCRPSLTKGQSLQPSEYGNIELLKLANAPNPDIKMISHRIEENVNLTVKLLRLVNSSHYFMNKITSVQHALAMLGMDVIKNWLDIVLMDSFLTSNKAPEIIKTSMLRMKLMESVGKTCRMDDAVDALKLIGLLSVLDVLLEKDIMEAVNPLPIDRELKITLFGRNSMYSDVYQLVLNYEGGVFNAARHYAQRLGISLDDIPHLYVDALQWSDERYALIYPNEKNEVLTFQ